MLNPVPLILALALFDDAFKASCRSIHDILSIRVPLDRDSYVLHWKESMLDLPLLREPQQGDRGQKITSLTSSTFSRYLGRLGRSAGFAHSIHPYMLRRAAANAVEG